MSQKKRRNIYLLLLCCWFVGCSEESADNPATNLTDTAAPSDTSTAEDSGTNASDSGSDTGSSGGDSSTTCGNGQIEEGEECDDGPNNNDEISDACRTNCQEASCGDGVVDDEGSSEQCDDGNSDDDDACNNLCRLPSCGDGVLQSGEQCDDGPQNSDTLPDACRADDCTFPRCGDAVTDSNEDCDDANDFIDDACINCTTARCGDGVIRQNVENCDDGNKAALDGCSDLCSLEQGFSCESEPSVCTTTCGDGVIGDLETCDDGNAVSGDGCASICKVQPGWTCNTDSPNVCTLVDVVRIPATGSTTTFEMGCPASDPWCYSSEQPVHTVTLSAYYIDVYEVTAAQYKACVTAGGCTAAGTSTFATYNVLGKENHPINYIKWEQASTYCAWIGKRLPTEAEWERAAKGPSHRRFPWSTSDADCPSAWGNGCTGSNWTSSTAKANCVESPCNDGYSETSPVGSFPSGVSPDGLHDMAGNVFEWTADWYYDTYFSSPSVDPTGPTSGTDRVARGGSGISAAGVPNFLRASYRANVSVNPSVSYAYVGVRCARSVAP